MTDSSDTSMAEPYSYHERVVLAGGSTTQRVRLESLAAWNPHTRVHPFGNLQPLWQGLPPGMEITLQVASGATQEFPKTPLDELSMLGKDNDSVPVGPAGVWMHIQKSNNSSNSTSSSSSDDEVKALILRQWSHHRLLTSPIHDVVWDDGEDSFQFFLPTTGAAWSADALQQSFAAMSVCNASNQDFFGLSALEWSQWLVEGSTRHKRMWWKVSTTFAHQYQFSFGIQFETTTTLLPPSLLSPKSSCPYGTRTVERVDDNAPPRVVPVLSVDQVLRRPWSNRGRLETWITATTPSSSSNNNNDCSLSVRQVLPPFITPTWQSLELLADDESSSPPNASVEWRDDGTSVLSVVLDSMTTTTTKSTSLVISLDYEPAFLTFDEFPGDPNRGRELPPAVVTLECNAGATTTQQQVFSNALLVVPPVPDMSMPFNVLSMTCSLYAFIVGSIVQLLVRKASEKMRYKLHPDQKPKTNRQKLKEKLIQSKSKVGVWLFQRRKQTSSDEDEKEKEGTTSDADKSTNVAETAATTSIDEDHPKQDE